MMNRHGHRPDRGMTLVEVLVATMIVMVAVLSVSAVYLFSGKETNRAVIEAEAARLTEVLHSYIVHQYVNPATGAVTDAVIPVTPNSFTPPTLGNQPEMQPNCLINTPQRLTWQFTIVPGITDKGVKQHFATVRISLDSDRNGVVSSGDDPMSTYVFYLFDTAP
jgi:type II secretory pathway pseudopilin PulG